MQIHELNNYSGSLGDAYLVADNGSDTGKMKTTALTDPLNARIDNIISSPAPSAAEIVDARLGADGKTYSSLGAAIRGQVSNLSESITDISGVVYEDVIPLDVYTNIGLGYFTMSGVWTASTTQISTKTPVFLEKDTVIKWEPGYRGQIITWTSDEMISGTSTPWLTGENVLTGGHWYTWKVALDVGSTNPLVIEGFRDYVHVFPKTKFEAIDWMPAPILTASNTGHKKIVTWVDDDTSSTQYISTVKGVCDTLGIKCTFATITDNWNTQLIDTLKSYQREGFHITSHTGNHNRWYKEDGGNPIFSQDECETDLVESLEALQSNGFIDSNYLVYPGSAYQRTDADIEKITRKWCACGVITNGNNYSFYGEGRYKINRIFFDKSVHDADYYKSILDNQNANNAPWIVFGSHSANGSQFDSSMIQTVLQYAKNNGWDIMTLNEAVKYRMKFYTIQEMFGL